MIEHSVTIIADNLMDIGVNVQKHTSYSRWDLLLTTPTTAQERFSALFNPWLISLIILFLLTTWNCYLSCRISKNVHVTLHYSCALQHKQSRGRLFGKLKWKRSWFRPQKQEDNPLALFPPGLATAQLPPPPARSAVQGTL